MNATDNVQVARVLITILDGHGKTLERGEAVPVNETWWEFETATSMEGKVVVEAFDLAGNWTKRVSLAEVCLLAL